MKRHHAASLLSLILLATLLSLAACTPPVSPTPPIIPPPTAEEKDATTDYGNPDQPIADRVDDLLSVWNNCRSISALYRLMAPPLLCFPLDSGWICKKAWASSSN